MAVGRPVHPGLSSSCPKNIAAVLMSLHPGDRLRPFIWAEDEKPELAHAARGLMASAGDGGR